MKRILSYLGNLTMYRMMLYFLRAIVFFAIIFSITQPPFGENILVWMNYPAISYLIQVVLFVEIGWGLNLLFARLAKTKANYESQIITGIILFLIMGPLTLPKDWLVLIVAPLAAMASKYLIVKNKSHILNPAAFGALASALVLGHPASWWAGGQQMLPILIIGGLLTTYQIQRFHLIVSFLLAYGLLLFVDTLVLTDPIGAFGTVMNLVLSSSLIFFIFVMLVEPLTSPQTRRRRIYFGIFVAVALFLIQRFAVNVGYSLELALLLGNVFALAISPNFRRSLVLKKKEEHSPTITSFWFEPVRPFYFKPGQFLEYTLNHPSIDDRGVRRYFTIASSPTEKDILLTTRFSDPGSTFKRALRQLKPEDEIIASKVDGDFVLPEDKTKKLVFIAGGIGVTPFRSMIKYLLDTNERRDITLIYSAKIESDLVFREIFDEVAQKLGVKNIYILSDLEHLPADWSGRQGIVNADVIKSEISDFADRIFYVSGPKPMVKAIENALDEVGVPRSQIVHDYFPGY